MTPSTPSTTTPSPRAQWVRQWFEIDRPQPTRPPAIPLPPITPAALWLITGASGAGKSTLMRCLRRRNASSANWIDLRRLPLPDRPIIDCLGRSLDEALSDLSHVGLAEAWTYLKKPRQLSEGERWRLRLAIAMRQATDATAANDSVTAIAASDSPTASAAGTADATSSASDSLTASATTSNPAQLTILACDEFASALDPVTAAIIARRLRRFIASTPAVAAVVASVRDDLRCWLVPTLGIRCDFGSWQIASSPQPQEP